MDDLTQNITASRVRSVRVDTLVRLRWLAILGQSITVLAVNDGLNFPLPIMPCLAIIALYAWINIALRARFRPHQRLEADRAAWLLGFDVAELTALLFLTGGLQNPFAFLLIGPVLISATILPARMTLTLAVLAVALRDRSGVHPLSAAVGERRPAGAAAPLHVRGLARDPARHRLYRRLRLADHQGIAPALRRPDGGRTRAHPRGASLQARRPRRRRRPRTGNTAFHHRAGRQGTRTRARPGFPPRRGRPSAARAGEALRRHPRQAVPPGRARRAVRVDEAVGAGGGRGRAPSRLRGRDPRHPAARSRRRTGRRTQSGDPLRPRQPFGERRRFCPARASTSPPNGRTRPSR